MSDRSWSVGEAVSDDYNCLVDTLRQVLKNDGIPWFSGYLERVQRDLATGAFAAQNVSKVREPSQPLGANFLKFLKHTRAVVRHLVQQAPDQEPRGINRRLRCCEPESMKFVCVDLDTAGFSVLSADVADAREIVFARESGNHFLPLRESDTAAAHLLPWETDIVVERRPWPRVGV